ncbi:MAG TPA: hypothetical protein VGR31_02225 [Planctomycetota bacterium]|nr:hypothetical protein [Planctomycetota bacterium]
MAALADYKGKEVRKSERALVGLIVYTFLKSFGHPSRREFNVSMLDTGRPRRIDFWVGSTKPVFIELAVRKPGGTQELMGKQNQSELSKLARANQAQVRTRHLLLIDLRAGTPIAKANLKRSYDPLHAGRGKFARAPVRVICVARKACYHFLWKPFAEPRRRLARP